MAFQKQWVRIAGLSQRVGIEGLDIFAQDSEKDLQGVYRPMNPPRCSCGRIGYANGYQERTVAHILNEYEAIESNEKPEIVNITVQIQRYFCPICKNHGTPKEIHYEPDFVQHKAKTTNVLNRYIGKACINQSPEIVTKSLGFSKDQESAVHRIFKKWADQAVHSYYSSLTSPNALGIHLFEAYGNKYFLVSDVKDSLVVDFFQYEDCYGMIDLLTRLAMMHTTSEVLSGINRECLTLVNGAFRDEAIVRAAAASIFSVFANDICQELDRKYSGRGKKVIKEWFATPLYEDLYEEPEVNRICTSPHGNNDWLVKLVRDYRQLRVMATSYWMQDAFTNWRIEARWHISPNCLFFKILDAAEKEISNSFAHAHLQRLYNDAEKNVYDIIMNNQKCSFEVLRYRILLTCQPKTMGIFSDGTTKYYNRGISITELMTKMKEYDA